MDMKRLYEILHETTQQYRKGDAFQVTRSGPIDVLEVFDMPHEGGAPEDLEMVDVHFMTIGVDKAKAEARKDELIALLRDYPAPLELSVGPSYIAVGATIGDQGAAFCLFALGKALGLWEIITPELLGLTGEEAHEAAGRGFIMMSGWRPGQPKESEDEGHTD